MAVMTILGDTGLASWGKNSGDFLYHLEGISRLCMSVSGDMWNP